jgi:CRISPR-associated protein Cas5d
MKQTFCLKVWGDYACFTRPEMKVERVSYDVITPSAARAIFEAILWKPVMTWRVTKIEVLNPIQWFSVRRNEVGAVASPRSRGIFIEDTRQQRAGLILRDVAYLLYAHFDLQEDAENTPGKFLGMFERRASSGQCFHQPYLGCREFSAHFELIENGVHSTPIDETRDLGWMLYDRDYDDQANPLFFRAQLENGILIVPPLNEVKR